MADNAERKGDYDPAGPAVFTTSARVLHPWVRSTGFRTHGLRFRSLGQWNDHRIAEDFLCNTYFTRQDRETEASVQSYFLDPGIVMTALLGREDQSGMTVVSLPKSVKLRRELGDVLERRRRRRTYTGDPLALNYLAAIVR